MLGVPLQMANEPRLLKIIEYLIEKAEDPEAEFQCEVGAPDAAGNRKVEIRVSSRVPGGAALCILTDPTLQDGKSNILFGYGPIDRKK
jgi:hypothetical protein